MTQHNQDDDGEGEDESSQHPTPKKLNTSSMQNGGAKHNQTSAAAAAAVNHAFMNATANFFSQSQFGEEFGNYASNISPKMLEAAIAYHMSCFNGNVWRPW